MKHDLTVRWLRRSRVGCGSDGASIVEAGAALTLLLPVMMLVLYVTLESSYAYLIKNSMNEASRMAARDLAIAYGQDSTIANDRSKEESSVFNNIRLPNMVNDSAQFTNVNWDLANSPATVSVTAVYTANRYSLPPFPNPDPLNLGGSFQVGATATYRLE